MCHGDLGGSSNFHRAKKDITDRVGALCLARGNQRQLYKIGTYYFSTEHAALRSKCKDWLAMNQDNVPEWNDMSARVLLFQ
jgi:hypothetical protein